MRSKNNRKGKVCPASQGAQSLTLACWNIRTMLDSADINRPGRRSALVAHELLRLNIDIAAVREVRFAGEGSLHEHSAGYTLYWSGKPEAKGRLYGMGFMIRSTIASKLENLPTGHSEQIISMRLPLWNEQHATMFSVYAPTLQAAPTEKEEFYTDLHNLVQNAPAEDKVFILGDFNSRVGKDSEAWKGVLGKHGVGNCNNNGHLLLEVCTDQQFTLTNPIFQQNSLKTAWIHPRSKHWHLIDYVQDVLHTRVMCNAECHTDHRLVRSKLRLPFKPKPKKGGVSRKKFQIDNFQSAEIKAKFQANLQAKLENPSCPTDSSPEALCAQIKLAILQTSRN
ncbi:craniofacial development protein 2-like [Penaeus chinensis]|uniref:craniofacial development protein 2-like n=1 Tax=Penaeus chinensis TaxID=139456 RepID=UPI001FB639CD|nr:craniofacial development protein 2-like [Penaeus chinensis]